jgi:hypothetical protein
MFDLRNYQINFDESGIWLYMESCLVNVSFICVYLNWAELYMKFKMSSINFLKAAHRTGNSYLMQIINTL